MATSSRTPRRDSHTPWRRLWQIVRGRPPYWYMPVHDVVSYIPDPVHPIKPAQISAACLVADVLGPEVRTHYISRYVSLELKEYRRIFRATDEAGGLDNISRRFAWFRRLLTGHETEAGRVFPVEWKVDRELFAKFVEITRSVWFLSHFVSADDIFVPQGWYVNLTIKGWIVVNCQSSARHTPTNDRVRTVISQEMGYIGQSHCPLSSLFL